MTNAPFKAPLEAILAAKNPVQTSVTPSQAPASTPAALPQTAQGEGGKPADPQAAPAATPAAEPKAEDPKTAARFAALAKQERDVQRQRQELKGMSEKVKAFEADQALKETDLLAWAKKHGVDYNKLTRQILNDGKPSVDEQIQATRKELSDMKEAQATKEASLQQANVDLAVKDFKSGISRFLEENKEKYELTHAEDSAPDEIYKAIDAHWNATYDRETGKGQMLSVEEAVKICEDELDAGLGARLEKYGKLKKFQSRMTPKADPALADKAVVAVTAAATSSPKTLSNAATSENPTPQKKKWSREESIKAATALIKFT